MAQFVFKVEDAADKETGKKVRRMTDGHALGMHCHLLYFNMRYYTPDGKTLLFGMYKEGYQALCLMELEPRNGEVTARTLLEDEKLQVLCTSLSPDGKTIYFVSDNKLYSIPMTGGECRKLAQCEPGWRYTHIDVSGDGSRVVVSATPNVDIVPSGSGTYMGFYERFMAIKEAKLMAVDTQSGRSHELVHVPFWISHAVIKPNDADTVVFCREGHWDLVDNRLYITQGAGYEKIRLQHAKEALGHEFWLPDSSGVAYHGHLYLANRGDGKHSLDFIGIWRTDGSWQDWILPCQQVHTQVAPGSDWFIGDGGLENPYIYRLDLPKDAVNCVATPLARHNGTWDQTQQNQPHPTVSTDGKSVFFNSNQRDLMGDIYQVFL